ncbi:MAG: MlaC/ttg2D family ABC transporter substrate-binding protein [Myxococcota bacterium]
MQIRMPTLAGALVAAAAVVATAATADAQAEQARRFLEKRHQAVTRVLQRSAGSEAARAQRNARLDQMLADLLDYEELAQRSLGSHWDARSASDRAQFVDLLKKLVERSYKRNLEQTLRYDVRYTSSEDGTNGVLVRTEARSRKNRRAPAVRIDYRLHESGGEWRVYDVITDGVSMVRNYRNQFNRIIDDEGWPGLIERMRNKLQSKDDLVE